MSRLGLSFKWGFGVSLSKFCFVAQAQGMQALNLCAVWGARTPMNVRFAPSLEYYCLAGL